MPDSECILKARGLTKRYGKITAVDARWILKSNPGRSADLLGPNGAGKTTNHLMLLGLTEPSAGSASILAGLHPKPHRHQARCRLPCPTTWALTPT